MKIEITGSTLQSFLALAQKFPNGTIIAKNGQAYWEFDGEMQQVQSPQQVYPQGQMQRPQPQQKNAFLRMFDTMGEYF